MELYGDGIAIQGDAEFRLRTRMALDALGATPSGAQLLGDIGNSGRQPPVFFTQGYYWSTENTTESSIDIRGTPVVIPSVPQTEQPLIFGELVSDRLRQAIPVKERRKITE